MSRRRPLCPLLRGKTGQAAIDTCLECPVARDCDPRGSALEYRDQRMVDLRAVGMPTVDIARVLGVNRRTVQRRLREKAGVPTWEEVRRQYQECFPRA